LKIKKGFCFVESSLLLVSINLANGRIAAPWKSIDQYAEETMEKIMVMVDRLPLSRRRSPGRQRGLLSLPFFCRIEGRVYAKFPKFKKKL
jgi:hypothetical protein